MKFSTEVTVIGNNTVDVLLPDMTEEHQVPLKLTFYQLSGPKSERVKEAVKDIQVRLSTRAELLTLNEPFFHRDNVVDLEPYWGFLEQWGRLKVSIANKSREPQTFVIETEYTECYGGVMYQERTDNFEKVLDNIVSKGSCTSLTMSFDKPLSKLQFLTTSECIEGDWIASFEAEIDNEKNEYTFDFTEDAMEKYKHYLSYMKLCVTSANNENVRGYFTAYGFPKTK